MRRVIVLQLCLLAVVTAGGLSAQRFEVAATAAFQKLDGAKLGSLQTSSPKENDTKFRNSVGYGVRVTWNTRGYYGHELTYLRTRPTLETKVVAGTETATRSGKINVQQAVYNFMMYFMPAGERWRPFFTAGMQMMQYGTPSIAEWTQAGTRNYGANYGGGLKLKLGANALLRFDARHYIGGRPYDLTFPSTQDSSGLSRPTGGSRVSHLEGSMGLAITF